MNSLFLLSSGRPAQDVFLSSPILEEVSILGGGGGISMHEPMKLLSVPLAIEDCSIIDEALYCELGTA